MCQCYKVATGCTYLLDDAERWKKKVVFAIHLATNLETVSTLNSLSHTQTLKSQAINQSIKPSLVWSAVSLSVAHFPLPLLTRAASARSLPCESTTSQPPLPHWHFRIRSALLRREKASVFASAEVTR